VLISELVVTVKTIIRLLVKKLQKHVGKKKTLQERLLNVNGSLTFGETTAQLVISESRLINQIPTTENSLPPLIGKTIWREPKNPCRNLPSGSNLKLNLKKDKRSLNTSMLLLKRWLTISQFIKLVSLNKPVKQLKPSPSGLSQVPSVILMHMLNAFPQMEKLSPVLHQLINSWENAPLQPSATLTLMDASELPKPKKP
jgi:hypothetical protein